MYLYALLYIDMKKSPIYHVFILTAFLLNGFGPLPGARADDLRLPLPGVMVRLSPPLEPPTLKGIKVHADNPFRFDFILDKGDVFIGAEQQDQLKDEAAKLIKYFLASLTIPEEDLWVNLSPYEKDRIIPQSFGLTEMGRDLLAEDYMLKQVTASLIYPEDQIGKKFWKRVYEEAAKKFGTTNIPVNTFNKVWIVPEKAVVYENAKAGTAYVVEAKLKVMLEEDYLSLSRHAVGGSRAEGSGVNKLGSDIVREIVIPELTKEVNGDKNFAKLRQVFNSLILATWYKKKIKDSILEQIYADKKKVAGVGYESSVNDVEIIYQRYLKAFKKGVYNYIKEDVDLITQETTPRKYFSGGMDLAMGATQLEAKLQTVNTIDSTLLTKDNLVEVSGQFDAAMASEDKTLMISAEVQHFFEHSLPYNKSLFPVYVTYRQPDMENIQQKVIYTDHFPLPQVHEFWKEGRIQAFRSKDRYILFVWGPGKRSEWEKETGGKPVNQQLWVPKNTQVRIRFIDNVELVIGPDKYQVTVDKDKNVKIQHESSTPEAINKDEPVNVPWGQRQRSVIKGGFVTFSKASKGEYKMEYLSSQVLSILKWESRPSSAFDFEGIHATGDAGKHNDNFGSVDTAKGTLVLTSGPRTIAGIVTKSVQSSISRNDFSKLKHSEIQTLLEEFAGQGAQEINNYRTQHPRAGKAGVSISLGVIIKDIKERGLLVGVNAGNTLFLRRTDKRTDLLSNKLEAAALGLSDTTSAPKLGYFIRSVTPGDLVVAVSPGKLDPKVIENIISQNDDPQEISRQLMEKAKAVTGTGERTNDMTVAVLKISPDITDSAQLARQFADQAMTSEISAYVNSIAERAYATMWNNLQVRRREKGDNAAWLAQWEFVKKDILYQQATCQRVVTEFLKKLLKSKFQDSQRVRSTLAEHNPWDINLHEFIVSIHEGKVFIIDPTYQQLIPTAKPGPAYKVLTVELSQASDMAKLFGIPEAARIWMIGIKQDPALFERIKSLPGYENLADMAMTAEDQQRVSALKEILGNLNEIHEVPVEVGPYTDKESPPFGKIDPNIQQAIGNGEFFEVHFKDINRPIEGFRDPRVFNLNRAMMALSVLMENSVKKQLPEWSGMHPSLTFVELFKNALFHGNSLNVDLPLFVRVNKSGIDVVDFGLGDPKQPWPDAVSGPAMMAGAGQGVQYIRGFGWKSFVQPLTPLTTSLDDQKLRSNVTSPEEFKAKMQEFIESGQPQIGTAIHIEPIQKVAANQQGSADLAMTAGEKLAFYMTEMVKQDQGEGDYTRVVRSMVYDPDLSLYVPDHEKGRFRDVSAAGEFYSRTSAYRVYYAIQWEIASRQSNSLKRRSQQVKDRGEANALNDLAKVLEEKPFVVRNKLNAKWAIIYEISRNNRLDKTQQRNFIESVKAAYRDRAMTVYGGIDLTPARMNLQTNTGPGGGAVGIKFHLDPAMLRQLQNAPGFVPVIINIQPMNDLGKFLGVNDAEKLIGV